jgi:peptide/nickel transport system substrate-binding protein
VERFGPESFSIAPEEGNVARQSAPAASIAIVQTLLLSACAPAATPAPTTAPKPAAPAPAAPAPAAPAPAPAASPAAAPAAPAPAQPAAASPAPAAAAKPSLNPEAKAGGTLVVAANNDPGHFNPGITTASGTHTVTGNIYSGLIFLDDKLNPQPDLAESWSIGEGGKSYTFKLRSGVKWHDGQAFSSADVKFSFEQVLLKYHARTKAGLENILEKIDTPDPNTVVFTLKQPYGPMLARLDVVEAPIMPKHVFETGDIQNHPANQKPVGTGPFKFVEYVKGDNVKLVRNDQYFKQGLPYLDQLVFKIIPDANTATLAFERGEVDFLPNVPGPAMGRLRGMSGVRVEGTWGGPGGSYCEDTLVYNLRKPPFDKLEVRQAFAHAIDRQQILEQVKFGQGRVATGPISSTMAWAYTSNVTQYPRDLAKANQLFDQAGFPRAGGGPRFKVNFPHATSFARHGEVMRQNLAEVGVDLNLQPLEVNAANDAVFVKQEFDMGIASYCNGPDPEIGVTRVYVSSNIKPIPFANGAAYSNPRVDELFTKAAATTEREGRAQAYGEIQQILTREVPYWWLVETDFYKATRGEYRDLAIWAGALAERAWWEKGRAR